MATDVPPKTAGTREVLVVGSIGEMGVGGSVAGSTGIVGYTGLVNPLALATVIPPETVGTRGEVVGEDVCAGGSLSGSLEGAPGRSVIEGTCALRDSSLVDMLTLTPAVPPKTAGTREV